VAGLALAQVVGSHFGRLLKVFGSPHAEESARLLGLALGLLEGGND